jgi:hypothetical protein
LIFRFKSNIFVLNALMNDERKEETICFFCILAQQESLNKWLIDGITNNIFCHYRSQKYRLAFLYKSVFFLTIRIQNKNYSNYSNNTLEGTLL